MGLVHNIINIVLATQTRYPHKRDKCFRYE